MRVCGEVKGTKCQSRGYALLRNKAPVKRQELIPATLLTREQPPESTDWAQ